MRDQLPPFGCLMYVSISLLLWIPFLAFVYGSAPLSFLIVPLGLGFSAFGSGYHLGRWYQSEHPDEKP